MAWHASVRLKLRARRLVFIVGRLNLSSCKDVFDATKDSLYVFLRQFLEEMGSVFSDELLMLGGDEVTTVYIHACLANT